METKTHDLLGGYTHERLDAAFKRVQSPRHWKAPIDCVLFAVSEAEVAEVLFAIEFFTATTGKAEHLGDYRVRITAPGYWAGPAN